MESVEHDRAETLITLTSDIVAAHVSNNSVSEDEVARLITIVHSALSGLGGDDTSEKPALEPAISLRSSVKKDYLVCIDCGKKMKMLRRHLSSAHGMAPQEYREKWGLKIDYPMIAPDYAETRSHIAVRIGLGRKPGQRRGRRNNAS